MRIIISNSNNYVTWPGHGTVRGTLPLGNSNNAHAEGFALFAFHLCSWGESYWTVGHYCG